jgi:hypothetical protein
MYSGFTVTDSGYSTYINYEKKITIEDSTNVEELLSRFTNKQYTPKCYVKMIPEIYNLVKSNKNNWKNLNKSNLYNDFINFRSSDKMSVEDFKNYKNEVKCKIAKIVANNTYSD